MRINQSFEQGVVCLLMLSLQKDGRAVGSETLSELMGVSDSYLKKTLRKLVLAGLVESRAVAMGASRLPAQSIVSL